MGLTVSEAIQEFDTARIGEVSDSTRRWYYWEKGARRGGKLWALAQFLGPETAVSAVTINDLRRWRRSLLERDTRWCSHSGKPTQAGGLSQDGFRNYIRAARHFFKWLVDEGLLEESPAARLPIPPPSTDEPKAIDIADARKILRIAYVLAQRDLAYFRLYRAGLRPGELDSALLDDVDLEGGAVAVNRRVRAGTYRPHLHTLSGQSAAALRAWLGLRAGVTAPEERPLLFSGRQGNFSQPQRGQLCFGVRNWAIAETLASTACRAGGIASMRRDHLDLHGRTVTVWEKGRGGYLKSRPAFLDDDAACAIQVWLSIHPGGDHLFPGTRGPLTGDGVGQIMSNLASEAGIDNHTNPHAWRHAWSIEALRAGADVTTVAAVLGNRPETVMHSYARWSPNHIQDRHLEFNWK